MKVFKYQAGIETSGGHGTRWVIWMPRQAHPLCAQEQHGALCIWAMVDPAAETEKREFVIFETGKVIPDGKYRYLGTVQFDIGSYVLHVYEALP